MQINVGSSLKIGGVQYICFEIASVKKTLIAQQSTESLRKSSKDTQYFKQMHFEAEEFSEGEIVTLEQETLYLKAVNGLALKPNEPAWLYITTGEVWKRADGRQGSEKSSGNATSGAPQSSGEGDSGGASAGTQSASETHSPLH